MMHRYVGVCLMLFVLASLALAFPPPYIDEAKVTLCESTGGEVNITIHDPDDYIDSPELDSAPSATLDCICPEDTTWDESAGCVADTSPESRGFIQRIIDFILKLLGLR